MTDQGVRDGSAQRKSEGGVTSRRARTHALDSTERTHQQAAVLKATEYIDSLKDGAEGDYGQFLVTEYFPKGFHTYPAADQLACVRRIELKLDSYHRTGYRIDGKGQRLAPADHDRDLDLLFGPERR